MKPELIAPCGMNCAICVTYFGYTLNGKRRKVPCVGCRSRNRDCAFLKKHCDLLATRKVEYCYECDEYPCERLERLDRGYKKRYHISMIDNLNFIQQHGMKSFLKQQTTTYQCPECGETTCVHTGRCYACSSNSKTQAPQT